MREAPVDGRMDHDRRMLEQRGPDMGGHVAEAHDAVLEPERADLVLDLALGRTLAADSPGPAAALRLHLRRSASAAPPPATARPGFGNFLDGATIPG